MPVGKTQPKRAPRKRPLTTYTPPVPGEIPRRALGSTGEYVSAVGLGGFHIGLIGTEREATRIVHAAIHVTSNHVGHRFQAFPAGAVVLLLMWVVFAIRILAL